MIVLGFLVWGITHDYTGLFGVLLVAIPSILLVIPNESIRNSKILGIILAIVLIFVILNCVMNILTANSGYNYYYYDDYSPGLLIFINIIVLIYCILNLISCYMLSVQTKKVESVNINNISKTNDIPRNSEDKMGHLIELGGMYENGLLTDEEFALIKKDIIGVNKENKSNKCPNCKMEINDEDMFCEHCGTKLKTNSSADSVSELKKNDTSEDSVSELKSNDTSESKDINNLLKLCAALFITFFCIMAICVIASTILS